MKTTPVPENDLAGIKDELDAVDVLHEKLADAGIPGAVIEFSDEEAREAGAFEEGALSEADAAESMYDKRADETAPGIFFLSGDDPVEVPEFTHSSHLSDDKELDELLAPHFKGKD